MAKNGHNAKAIAHAKYVAIFGSKNKIALKHANKLFLQTHYSCSMQKPNVFAKNSLYSENVEHFENGPKMATMQRL